MSEHDDLAEARVGAGPVALPRPLESAAEMADFVRQVRIDHAPQLEDDDQGPFLHFSDASGIALACWPRIIAALSAARREGAAEAYERAAKAATPEWLRAAYYYTNPDTAERDHHRAPDISAWRNVAAAIRALAEREVRT